MEQTDRAVRHGSAKAIFEAIQISAGDFSAQSDDISIVVIKRT
jgi:hypothetical protein